MYIYICSINVYLQTSSSQNPTCSKETTLLLRVPDVHDFPSESPRKSWSRAARRASDPGNKDRSPAVPPKSGGLMVMNGD